MYCRDCKYLQKSKNFTQIEHQIKYGKCTHPKSVTYLKLHTGEREYHDASFMREMKDKCGPHAVHYTNKSVENDDKEVSKKVVVKDKANICIQCKYFVVNQNWYSEENKIDYGLCTHPKLVVIDPVTGNIEYPYAVDMRSSYTSSTSEFACGLKGHLFEMNEDTKKVTKHVKMLEEARRNKHNIDTLEGMNDTMERFVKSMIFFMFWLAMMLMLKK